MKHLLAALLVLGLFITPCLAAPAPPELTAPSAILMEKATGTILCEQEAHTQYEPASVTKVMTLLLVFEALDSGALTPDQMVTASAHAVSMGGSQIWLKENEQMSVTDMIKAVAVVSANDCAVALAEHLAGSEDAFVQQMNQRASELGMTNTNFVNCTGLPAEGHLTTAHDIALMSRELMLHHPDIRAYTTIWMDTLRDGAFQLSNTNKLVRFYQGATGLKTGYTDSALYCLSATAEREGMELISVVMHAPTSNDRFESAKALLNYGFANYRLHTVHPDQALPPVSVVLGETATVQPVLTQTPSVLLEKGQSGELAQSITLTEEVEAPVEEGQSLGTMTVTAGDQVVVTIPIVAAQSVERLGVTGIFRRILAQLFLAC